MKSYNSKTLSIILYGIALVSCQSQEPDGINKGVEPEWHQGEITCAINSPNCSESRSYFEYSETEYAFLGKWDKEDKIAVIYDSEKNASLFTLKDGDAQEHATFVGFVRDNYNSMTAVYPADVFESNNDGILKVKFPERIEKNKSGILSGLMPMVAKGTNGHLYFSNLMGAIKITLSGNGLLRSITITSPDGLSLSGAAEIHTDIEDYPTLIMNNEGKDLTLDVGALFLTGKQIDFYIPVPAVDYPNGLKVKFNFVGCEEEFEVKKATKFQRSMIRPVTPYTLNMEFDPEKLHLRDNEIFYQTTMKTGIKTEDALGSKIKSHEYSSYYKSGIIIAEEPITRIEGQLFNTPSGITNVRIPEIVERISHYAFQGLSISKFDFPSNLKSLGVGAFDNCINLEKIILPKGVESLGLSCFSECENLTEVYLPESIKINSAYSFLRSTKHLDHWDGDCELIDKDRHTLYENSSYGSSWVGNTTVGIVAGCNLEEYVTPENVWSFQFYSLNGCCKLKKLVLTENIRSMPNQMPPSDTLETIISYPVTPPSFAAFEKIGWNNVKEILVPAESVDLYKQADYWKEFASKIKAM